VSQRARELRERQKGQNEGERERERRRGRLDHWLTIPRTTDVISGMKLKLSAEPGIFIARALIASQGQFGNIIYQAGRRACYLIDYSTHGWLSTHHFDVHVAFNGVSVVARFKMCVFA
jgi:hypothetical protein